MADLKEAWTEVGNRLSSLGLKLKLHAEEELADRDGEIDDALGRMRQAVEDIADAVGDAARDPAVRTDLRELADSLATAAKVSVDEVREALDRRS